MDTELRLHLEPTTRCTANCAQCLRRTAPSDLLCRDMDLTVLNENVPLHRVREVDLCGNFGDPCVYPELVDLVLLFRPTCNIRIHTNGFCGTPAFWRNLADFHNVQVVFAIDGLTKESHERNRIGTRYEQVLKNATIFTEAGGNAVWYMLVFQHNEHEVRACCAQAKARGFSEFHSKVSDRFYSYDAHAVVEEVPAGDAVMAPPTEYNMPPLCYMNGAERFKYLKDTSVACWYPKSLFIDAQMRVFPCCITAAAVSEQYLGLDHTHRLLKKHGTESLRLGRQQFRDILEGPYFTEFLETLTAVDAQHGCKVCCGGKPCMPVTAFREVFK